MRFLTRRHLFAYLVLAAVAVAGGWVWKFLHDLRTNGLPTREGVVQVQGLDAVVDVRYDRWGVPYIRAASLDDAVFAIGWVHANDRLGQMELTRRAAHGRVSELVGEVALELDELMVRLRVGEIAQRNYKAASPRNQALLDRYAAGVNAWMEERRGDLPPLFTLTGLDPAPWRPADSLCIPALMSVGLSFVSERVEEERYVVLRELGEDALRDWVGAEVEIPAELLSFPYERELSDEAEKAPHRAGVGGSNNWVVGTSRTSTGAPLVANDPHLELRLPSIWFQLHVRAPGLEVAGMGLPGIPGVVIGHNANVGWGFTNVMLDDHDLFFEEVDESGERVRRGDDWVPMGRRTATIEVKDGDPVEIELRTTDLGPVLDADPEKGLPARSFVWTAYVGGDALEAFLGMAGSTNLEEALDAAGLFTAPAQNIVIGDQEGGIGWTILGRQPERQIGDGRLPAPAWREEFHWKGLLDSARNPRLARPDADFVLTANSRVEPVPADPDLTCDYDTHYRALRIRERIEDGGRFDAQSLAEIHSDTVDLYARDVLRLIEPELASIDANGAALLRQWDHHCQRFGEAALFWLFHQTLWDELFGDEIEQHHVPPPSPFLRRQKILAALRGEMRHDWFDDVRTDDHRESRADIVERALRLAHEECVATFGADPANWDYGEELHHLTIEHALGELPVLGSWFNRGPYPMGGSATTVNALGGNVSDWKEISWGPSMRVVWDPADWDRSRSILPGGQSGHPGDPHYDDQLPLYLSGESRVFPWTEEAIRAATVSNLRLEP